MRRKNAVIRTGKNKRPNLINFNNKVVRKFIGKERRGGEAKN